jgi:hypothetical protein
VSVGWLEPRHVVQPQPAAGAHGRRMAGLDSVVLAGSSSARSPATWKIALGVIWGGIPSAGISYGHAVPQCVPSLVDAVCAVEPDGEPWERRSAAVIEFG